MQPARNAPTRRDLNERRRIYRTLFEGIWTAWMKSAAGWRAGRVADFSARRNWQLALAVSLWNSVHQRFGVRMQRQCPQLGGGGRLHNRPEIHDCNAVGD